MPKSSTQEKSVFAGLREAREYKNYVNGAWVDSTTSVDTAQKTVCGVVTSLASTVTTAGISPPGKAACMRS